jgi:hypothetical protein
MSDKTSTVPAVHTTVVSPTVSSTTVFDSDGSGKSHPPSASTAIVTTLTTSKQGISTATVSVHGQVAGTSIVCNNPA